MRNSITADMDEFGKVGAEMSCLLSQMHSDYDSAESIADSDLEDGELRKMLASPLYKQDRDGASAKRTQADQVRLRNREQRRNLLQCFRQEVRNREFNQEFHFQKTLIRQNLGRSLFLKARKIICSVRQDLNL